MGLTSKALLSPKPATLKPLPKLLLAPNSSIICSHGLDALRTSVATCFASSRDIAGGRTLDDSLSILGRRLQLRLHLKQDPENDRHVTCVWLKRMRDHTLENLLNQHKCNNNRPKINKILSKLKTSNTSFIIRKFDSP